MRTPEHPAFPGDTHADGRLRARPCHAGGAFGPGTHWLGLAGSRDAQLHVPARCTPGRPTPFVLMLHGAGGDADHGLAILRAQADVHGLILLAPASRAPTWDVINGGYGPDVALIDRALEMVFEGCVVDPERLAIGGFSDGASYALSLGITNGDLFTHVLAFSPGFAAPADVHGAPGLFLSHGTEDRVLPITPCSRTLVPRLERAGYAVRYREFEGGHVVPDHIADEAVDWMLSGTDT